jgi:hypothetical protein
MTYSALVTFHARIDFDAANDQAAIEHAEWLSYHPQAAANRAKMQQGWMCDGYGTIALHKHDRFGEPDEEIYSI